MKIYRTPVTIYFLLLLGFSLGWGVALQFIADKTTVWNYLYNLVYGLLFLSGAAVGISNGIKLKLKNTIGKALLFLGLGLLVWAIGLVVWVYYNLILNVEIPFPSIADIFFVLIYPLLGIGCYFFLKLFSPIIPRKFLIESLVIIVVAFVAIFIVFLRPDLSADLSWLTRVINVAYPMGDVVLVSMSLIAVRLCGGRIHASLLVLAAGFLIQAVADFTYTYRTASEVYWNGDIADILYTFGGFTISMGVVGLTNSLGNGDNKV